MIFSKIKVLLRGGMEGYTGISQRYMVPHIYALGLTKLEAPPAMNGYSILGSMLEPPIYGNSHLKALRFRIPGSGGERRAFGGEVNARSLETGLFQLESS